MVLELSFSQVGEVIVTVDGSVGFARGSRLRVESLNLLVIVVVDLSAQVHFHGAVVVVIVLGHPVEELRVVHDLVQWSHLCGSDSGKSGKNE